MSPPKDKVIEPIDANMDAVAKAIVNPRGTNDKELSVLIPYKGPNPRGSKQGELDLQIQKQVEIDGIGMGVLSDGTAFLNGRGLAKLCGVDSSRISEMSADWDTASLPLTARVKELLKTRGITLTNPYIEIHQRSGKFHAFPDVLCLAVLEYYSFDISSPKEQAQKNYRLLAGKGLHDFIFTQVGYDPNNKVPPVWQQFHDRISLTYNSVPKGYFSIFKEIADMIFTLGEAGLHIDKSFVPDGSVGSHWSKHWAAIGGDAKYGQRKEWGHNFPHSFPQAKSNPQPAWCYPNDALGEFRRWLQEEYIEGGKFATYINGQIKKRELPASFAQLVTSAYNLDTEH